MSLYESNDRNLNIRSLAKIISLLKENIKVAKIIAIPLLAVALCNLISIALDLNIIIIMRDSPRFIFLEIWSAISAVLLIYFCFSNSYISLIPLIIVCALQFFGWATAHEEMTYYSHSENRMTLIKSEYLNYFDSIRIIPYYLIGDLTRGMTLNSIKIFWMFEEFIKFSFLCFSLHQKIKFGSKK